MQRFVSFLLMVGFSLTLSAEEYFEAIRDAGESLDSVTERIVSIKPSSVSEDIGEELPGVQNRLGAAQAELLLLRCMGWLIDWAADYDLLEDGNFEQLWVEFVYRLRDLLGGVENISSFRTWFFESASALTDTPIPDLQRTRFSAALNALVNNVLAVDPQTNARVIRFPQDVDVFFDSHDVYFTTPLNIYRRLIHSVAMSLFNLTVEIAASAAQNAIIEDLYREIFTIVTALYTLLGVPVPGLGRVQLSPRSLSALNINNANIVQLPSPRNGPLSPRVNFDVPYERNMENLPLLRIPESINCRLSVSTGSIPDLVF